MLENKILYGFSDIHVCKQNGTPVKILGGINVNIDIIQEYQMINNIRFNGKVSGKGRITLLNLSEDEQEIILGYKKSSKGGISLGVNNNPPKLKLLFSREKGDGNKILYCVYCCMFNPSSIKANTHINTNGLEEDVLEIDFDVLVDSNNKLIYYAIDTSTGDKNTCDNWFKEIQYP